MALINRTFGDAKFLCPFPEAKGFTVIGKPNYVAFVLRLFSSRGPSTIIRAIISVHVNSIKRHALWFFAHIISEVHKRPPALFNNNSPASIVREVLHIGVVTTPMHRTPSLIKWCFGKAMNSSAVSNSIATTFAPTRLAVSPPKRTREDRFFISAGTAAHPLRWFLSASWDAIKSRQIAKLFARKNWPPYFGHVLFFNTTGTTTQ